MRVDDNVGCQALAAEGHVLLAVLNPACSLLPVSRGKLVTDLRDSDRPHTDLDELISIRVERDHDLIDNTSFRVTEER